MTRVFFDIETRPDPELISLYSPDLDVKYGNTKDPEKRRAIEIEAEQKQTAEAALNPHVSRVMAVAAGWLYDDGRVEVDARVAPGPGDKPEADILAWLSSALDCHNLFGSFNGLSFDCPYLARRAALLPYKSIPAQSFVRASGDKSYWGANGINARYPDALAKHASTIHVDLRGLLCASSVGNGTPPQFRRGDLTYYCRLFGLVGKNGIPIGGFDDDLLEDDRSVDHAKMWQIWEANTAASHDQIGRLVRGDVRRTIGLYQALRGKYIV